MPFDASRFILNRPDPLAITNKRIKDVLWYLIECYQLVLKDDVQYSQSWVKDNTTIHFEDYLKFEFIDRYLTQNKHLLKKRISELEEVNFFAESQQRYFDTADHKIKPDKIDICINKLGLQKQWRTNDENVYFAIECKRISRLSDTRDYVTDIEKFCNRNHTNLRLPFEGQLAFIEKADLTHSLVSEEVNRKLRDLGSTVTTDLALNGIQLHDRIDCCYISKHRKIFNPNSSFSIYHLMFDYSTLVTQ